MFLIVLLPFSLLGVSLVADFSRAIVAGRKASNAADTIAMAAATAFDADEGDRLDRDEAQRRADDMLRQIIDSGMLPAGYQASILPVTLSDDRRTVTVELTFQIAPFTVADAIVPGRLDAISGRSVRSAEVCIPDDQERIDGAGCSYPVL